MLLISGGLLLSALEPAGLNRDILIDGDTIVDIVAPGTVKDENIPILDASGHLIIPGLINSHTHSSGGLSKGLGDLWSLELLLNALPSMGGRRGPEIKYLASLINAVEQVEKGTTACYDLVYEFPVPTEEGLDAVAAAYDKVGMRAVIAPMVADRTFYQSVPGLIDAMPEQERDRASGMRMPAVTEILASLRSIASNWRHPSERLRLGLAPTIPQSCSMEFLLGCRDLAREFGLPIQTHISEARFQAATSLANHGMSMTHTMDSCGLVGPWFSAAHGVWLTEADMDILARKDAQIAHNPGSNLRFGAGIAAVRDYLSRGITVGLGTDGAPSSNNQNLFEAMRLAAYVSRVRGRSAEEWISASDALTMATEGSARILGMQGQIGKIATGYKADMVLLDLDSINYIPLNDALSQVVLGEDGTAVDKVLIGGRLVVDGGKALNIDHAQLARAARDAAKEIAEFTMDARKFAARLEPVVSRFCCGLSHSSELDRLGRDIHATGQYAATGV